MLTVDGSQRFGRDAELGFGGEGTRKARGGGGRKSDRSRSQRCPKVTGRPPRPLPLPPSLAQGTTMMSATEQHRGKIEIKTSLADDQLTVEIIQAKGLIAPDPAFHSLIRGSRARTSDAYVKMYLMPDETKKSKQKTKVRSPLRCTPPRRRDAVTRRGWRGGGGHPPASRWWLSSSGPRPRPLRPPPWPPSPSHRADVGFCLPGAELEPLPCGAVAICVC